MKKRNINFWQLLFLTMAFFASIRRIPNIAYAGWESVFFMVFALIFFVTPVSFVSAELATAMPQDGGLSVWISKAISPRWGFTASFLVWIQMCFGMVTVGAAFANMIATILGKKELLTNNVFIGIVVIALFWLVTLLIIKGVPITAISTYGTIFGLLLPLAVLLIGGTIFMLTKSPHTIIAPTTAEILPNMSDFGTLANLSGIIFLFAGMEQASNYANKIENPRKTYPRAIIFATLLVAGLFTYAGLITSNLLPAGTIDLADPAQVFNTIFSGWNIPWMTTVIAVMIAVSCVTEISVWTSGPSRSLLENAKRGILPPVFAKTNKHDIPVPIMILQAIIVTGVAMIFVLIPGTNDVFDTILTMAVSLYAIVYLLILIAGIKFRKANPNAKNAFKLPGGKIGAAVITTLGILGLIFVLLVGLIPPISSTERIKPIYTLFIIAGTAIFTAIPLLIYKKYSKKEQ